MKEQLRKKMILSIFCCIASLSALIYATIAWFAANDRATAGGFQLSVEKTPYLVIAKSPEELQAIQSGEKTDDNSERTVVFTEPDPDFVLAAANHDWSVGTDTGLKYNTNPVMVSYTTGNKRLEDVALTYGPVPVYQTTDKHRYYVDYEVYIASKNADLENTDLYAEIENVEGTADLKANEYKKASSIDFYVDEVSPDNYKGTLNLAEKSIIASGKVTKCDNIYIDTIEKIESNNPVHVIMRFYFDGALQDDGVKDDEGNIVGTKAYIRSALVPTDKIHINVKFTSKD